MIQNWIKKNECWTQTNRCNDERQKSNLAKNQRLIMGKNEEREREIKGIGKRNMRSGRGVKKKEMR